MNDKIKLQYIKDYFSVINPYNISKEKIRALRKNPKGFGEMAIARYERYLKSIKKNRAL